MMSSHCEEVRSCFQEEVQLFERGDKGGRTQMGGRSWNQEEKTMLEVYFNWLRFPYLSFKCLIFKPSLYCLPPFVLLSFTFCHLLYFAVIICAFTCHVDFVCFCLDEVFLRMSRFGHADNAFFEQSYFKMWYPKEKGNPFDLNVFRQ